MKDLIEVHFDEFLLVCLIAGFAVLYIWRPDVKEWALSPLLGALIMALRSKTKNGNGAQPPKE